MAELPVVSSRSTLLPQQPWLRPPVFQVVLADPKDRNKDIVVFLASEHQADAPDEAEQRAAITALHRVAGDRALHRVLPQAFLPLWQELCAMVSSAISTKWPHFFLCNLSTR